MDRENGLKGAKRTDRLCLKMYFYAENKKGLVKLFKATKSNRRESPKAYENIANING